MKEVYRNFVNLIFKWYPSCGSAMLIFFKPEIFIATLTNFIMDFKKKVWGEETNFWLVLYPVLQIQSVLVHGLEWRVE